MSPQPIVTRTSAARRTLSDNGFGWGVVKAMPRSWTTVITVGLTSAAGDDPGGADVDAAR